MLSLKTFLESIRFVNHAAAVKDVRWYLNGVALDFSRPEDKEDGSVLYAVATDGSRIARVSMVLNEADVFDLKKTDGPIIIDGDSVAALLAIKKPSDTQPVALRLIKGDGDKPGEVKTFLVVQSGAHSIRCNLIDGKYPDYRRVIPAPEYLQKGTIESADIGLNASFLAEGAAAIAKLHKSFGNRYMPVVMATHPDNITLHVPVGSMSGGGLRDPIVKIMAMRR